VVADHRAQVEEMLADYRRSRETLASVHRDLAAVRGQASSPDGLVRATVSAQGVLTALDIAESAYDEHRPAQLAALIVAATEAAAEQAAHAAGTVLAPVLPADTDPEALLAGTADLTAQERTPKPPAKAQDAEESLEDVVWMRSGSKR